jgi:hypothetical protein
MKILDTKLRLEEFGLADSPLRTQIPDCTHSGFPLLPIWTLEICPAIIPLPEALDRAADTASVALTVSAAEAAKAGAER